MTIKESIILTDIIYQISIGAPYLLFYRTDEDELVRIINYRYDPTTKGCTFFLEGNAQEEFTYWEFEMLESDRIELYKLMDINKFKTKF